jgi:hypothetical protein
MKITSRLTPLDGGATQVQVVADVDIVGRAAQFGRGMVESVNKQIFRQFTECLRGTLEGPEMAELKAEPLAPTPPTRPTTPTTARVAGAIPKVPAPAEPLRIVPLVARAVIDWLRRLGVALIGRPRHP